MNKPMTAAERRQWIESIGATELIERVAAEAPSPPEDAIDLLRRLDFPFSQRRRP